MFDSMDASHKLASGDMLGLVVPICVSCGAYGRLSKLLRGVCQGKVAVKRRYCMHRVANGFHPNGAFGARPSKWMDATDAVNQYS